MRKRQCGIIGITLQHKKKARHTEPGTGGAEQKGRQGEKKTKGTKSW